MRKLAMLALLCVAPAAIAAPKAELKLIPLFSDNMVLQGDIPAPIWGTAEAGEEVPVSIAGQKKSAKAGADGKWIVKLESLNAVGPHEPTVSRNSPITLKNV